MRSALPWFLVIVLGCLAIALAGCDSPAAAVPETTAAADVGALDGNPSQVQDQAAGDGAAPNDAGQDAPGAEDAPADQSSGGDTVDAAAAQQCVTVADCPAAPACHAAACTLKGTCAYSPKSDGSLCDDGNACTTGDLCTSAACAGPSALDCNDDNPCTGDKCNPLAGCVNLPVAASTACDDGNVCTAGDACEAGKCQPGAGICQCQANADCGKFEDGDLCNGTLYCDKSAGPPYTCKLNPATLVVCPKDNDGPCQKNACLAATGSCQLVTVGENTPCDDGDKCTAGDYCEKGLCHAGTNTCYCKQDADCKGQEDGNACNGTLFCNKATAQCEVHPLTVVTCQTYADTACSKNLCNPKDGKCHYIPVAEGKPCDDGNACTPNEVCQQGACTTATNICECAKDADCAKKEDGNLCNGTLYCDVKANACKVNPATVVACVTDDDPACLRDVCNAKTGKCEALSLPKDGTGCDDGNACTPVDVCKGGQCTASVNTCECQQDGDCKAKEDGNLCNGTLYCDKAAGKCAVNPATVIACPSVFDEACLKNQCDPKTGGCGMKPTLQGNQCGGDNACSAGGWCNLGTCEVTAGSVCACSTDQDCGKFDDGDLCTGTMYCDKTGPAPVCKVNPNTVVVCPKVNDTACTKNQCAPQTGACKVTVVSGVCDDFNPCTTADLCANGNCKGGDPLLCNDGNACTKDACQVGFGCVSQALDPSACDDQNPCTGDGCDPAVGCTHGFASNLCSDGDPCTQGDACKFGACKGDSAQCDDANVCTDDACKSDANGCVYLPNAATCSDGNACTVQDVCALGKCVGNGAANCDDGSACTTDACSPKVGCQHGFAAASCDDGNPCTLSDGCKDGACVGTAKVCDDGSPCTNDACDPKSGCTATANAAPCSDGNACTSGDACKDGACGYGKVVVCSDSNPCTDDACDPKSGCVTTANTAPCDDGNACTQKDVCKLGLCAGLAQCEDGNPCTDDGCAAGQCAHVNNGGACNDGNACTTGDKCAGGKCAGAGKLACDDNNVCTEDGCDPTSGCTQVANSATCDDANACTAGDACKSGACKGANKPCDDNNACTDDSCDIAKGCLAVANTKPCDDSNACTPNDACAAGKCAPGKTKDCDDNNVCTADACLPTTGQCQHVNTAAKACDDNNPCTDDSCHFLLGCGHANNAVACSDGNPCTDKDGCANAKCAPGDAIVCDDGKLCTDDACDPKSGCVANANTKACDDGVACTINDKCSGGKCAGTVNCDDKNPCTDDSCLQGACSFAANSAACNDNNPCTLGEACAGGACKPAKVVLCDDGDVCTDDYCDTSVPNGCANKFNSAPCSFPGSCAQDDVCVQGKCTEGKTGRLGTTTFGTIWDPAAGSKPGLQSYDEFLGGVTWDSGSFVGLGRTAISNNSNESHAAVVRFKPNGDVQWASYWNDVGTVSHAWTGFVRPDGKLMVAGWGGNLQGKFIATVAADGKREALWKPRVSKWGDGQAFHLGPRPTGGATHYVLCGQNHSDGLLASLVVVDATGKLVTDTEFGYWGNNNHNRCVATFPWDTASGDLVWIGSSNNAVGMQAGGANTSLGGVDAVFGKVVFGSDGVPKLTLLKRYGGTENDFVHRVIAKPSGAGWFVAGSTMVKGQGMPDAWVFSLDHLGNLEWEYKFGTPGPDEAWGLAGFPDGTVVASGWVREGTTSKNAIGVRLNHKGMSLWTLSANLASLQVDTWQDVVVPADGDLRFVGTLYSITPGHEFLVNRVDPWGATTCSLAGGICGGKRYKDCDDGNWCTDDHCDYTSGCKSIGNKGKCEDGNACTPSDTCNGATCESSPAKDCDDGNPCTTETCDPKQCVGYPCNQAQACKFSTMPDGVSCGTGKVCKGGKCE
ncbi:MAG: hypothetical protein FJ100_08775 [Deltaproteobacteria bacterium]|nr:hypothetical protein [Deltaproteobacteria bacterium]